MQEPPHHSFPLSAAVLAKAEKLLSQKKYFNICSVYQPMLGTELLL